MPSDLPDNGSARARAVAFRDAALAVLHEAGVTAARRPNRVGDRPGFSIHDDASIGGLPWLLTCHRQATIDLSGALDGAAMKAELLGTDLYAALFHRRAHDIEESYAVMPLAVLADVLLRLHPESARPSLFAAP